MHAFVDESMRGGRYLMAAFVVAPSELAVARRTMRSLLLPRQRRLHMTDEGHRRRGEILAAISKIDSGIRIYETAGGERSGRPACLRPLLTDAFAMGVSRLVIESGGQRDHRDRLLIHESLRRDQPTVEPSYEHLRSPEEPLLWAADAVLWAWGAGGRWRQRVPEVELRRIEP